MLRRKKLQKKKRITFRKRVCQFCMHKVEEIDYKDVVTLGKYISERGKMISRRNSGVCAKHQRRLAQAIKRSRCIALLPYVRK